MKELYKAFRFYLDAYDNNIIEKQDFIDAMHAVISDTHKAKTHTDR